ncbi:MAG: hypothetical protein FJ351_03785 [Sphingomonadales bacterium]|nr:hypothetical protein [Sphingomonadales bacterium]
MPNWITNELTIDTNAVSKSIKEELKFYVSKDDDGKEGLDFDRVIRMPPSLQITAGGSVEEAMAVIKGDLKFFSERLKWWKGKGSWLEKEGIKTAKALMEHSRKRLSEKELGEGKTAIENLRKYGHKDWYDWCCANWGTKWNASDTHWNDNSVSFLTAWAPPDPVIQKMADETGHAIQNMWFDEGDVEDVHYTTFSPNSGDN